MLVAEVMSSPAITVTPRTTVRAALRLLDAHGITAMPVVGPQDDLVGVVSEADLLCDAIPLDTRRHMMPIHITEWAPARTVSDVMSTYTLTVSGDSDLADAVELMTSSVVKSLPVVDRGKVVGVVSRKDIVHVLARKDERIQAELDDLVRSDGADWEVEVEDGVVRVIGPVTEHERRIAKVLAGSVTGVVAVWVG